MMAPSSIIARRARFALLGAAALFLLSQLAFNILIEGWQPCIRYPEYGYRLAGLRRLLAEERGRPLLLALGTSRTEMGFRPDVLPSYRTATGAAPLLFNFGIGGSSPLRELLHLERLLAEGIRPDWLLWEIMPASQYLSDGGRAQLRGQEVTWLDLGFLSNLSPNPLRLDWSWFAERLVPVHADRKGLLCRYGPHFFTIEAFQTHGAFRLLPDRFGWLGWGDPNPTQAQRRRFLANVPTVSSAQVSAGCDRILRQMLDLCRKERIPVVLYLMPEGDEYRRRYVPGSVAALDAYLARLTREYGVRLVDARRWIAEEDFIDSHHLLQRGARRYTERLGRELIRPLVSGELR